MILVDYIGHMVSTESEEELHTFAKALGLKRAWYQSPKNNPHYDLTTPRMRGKAIRMGATEADPRDLVQRAWWWEKRRQALEAIRVKRELREQRESKESSHEHKS